MLETDQAVQAHAPVPDFRALFESAPGRYLVLAPDLTIVAASDAYLEALGTSRDEIVGHGLFEALLADPDDPRSVARGSVALRDSLLRVLRGRVPDAPGARAYDLPRGADAPPRAWGMLNTPVLSAGGDVAAVIHRIEQPAGPPPSPPPAPTPTSAGEALRTAEEALCEADRRKDEFLAMLAHELRNPLAAINNAVTLCRRDGGEAYLSWSLEVIGRQAAHLSLLIDDLLDVSRITRGKIRLRTERIALGDVVGRAVEATRPLVESRGHALTVALGPGPIWLDADPLRLEQILTNLLNNAAAYTEPGGRLWLSAGGEGGELVLRVSDTGVGIAPDVLPRIFDLFAQADRPLDCFGGGLGVGLTLVKSLAQMHGGSVEARSAGPGHGSEFVVRLPLPEPSRDSPAPAGSPASPPAAARGRRVLVVDDNIDSATSLAMIVEFQGHETRLAHDGPSALEAAASFRPDVALLDIGLPGLDGYQVARRLRNSDRGGAARMTLVALTGYGQHDDRLRTREGGFDHHMVKPIDIDALLDLLDRPATARPDRIDIADADAETPTASGDGTGFA